MKLDPNERRAIRIDGVFDIETEKWDRFVLGALRTRDGETLVFDWNEEEKLVDAILAHKGALWAHNGGRYDALWLAKHFKERKLKVHTIPAGGRIILMRYGDLEIFDSAALIPLSLAQAADLAGGKKVSTGLPCKMLPECNEGCGGYCSIRVGMPSGDLEKLRSYLINDCAITVEILQALSDYAERHDLDLGTTIGSSAWRCAKRLCDLDDASWHLSDYKLARHGYFGGRVQVFRPLLDRGHKYDINSAYPAALARTAVPVGERKIVPGRGAEKYFRKNFPGIYAATVDVPPMHIPILPVRGKERLAYPTGKVEGAWTGIELAYAESIGCKILFFDRSIVWKDAQKLLRPFVQKIWKLRAKAIKDNPLGKKGGFPQWLKLYANSLTGKFAQNPIREQIHINPTNEELDKAVNWRALDEANEIWVSEINNISQCAHVQWAAYLTAATRIELHKQLVRDGQGGKSAVYCDTDSVFSSIPRTENLGEELGQWADEGFFRNFVALAPKVYCYEEASGKKKARAKGIPDAARNWERIVSGMPVPITRGVDTFKTAAKRGNLFSRKKAERVVRANGFFFGDRILKGDLTYPPTTEDLACFGSKALLSSKRKDTSPTAKRAARPRKNLAARSARRKGSNS